MTIVIKAAFAALALSVAASSQPRPAAQPQAVPLPGATLSFDLPADFVRVTNRNNGTNVLIEYVPRGQSVANWTRMVTIQAYKGLGASPVRSADLARQAFYPAACTVGPIYRDGGERVVRKGLMLSVIATGCASLPAGAYPKALKGAGEQDFILFYRDARSVYTLNYAERGVSFAGRTPPRDLARSSEFLQDIFGTVSLMTGRVK